MATSESADEVEALLSMATEVVPGSATLQLAGLSNLEGNIITEVSMSELKPIVMTMANMANISFDQNFDGVPEPASVVQISDRSETVLASHLLSDTTLSSAQRTPRIKQTSSEVYRDSSTGVTYEIQRGGTRRGGDKLIDSLGFTYNLKAGKGNTNISYWWCAVRNQQLRCPASVTQKGNVFMRGKRKHEHLVGQSTPKPSHGGPSKVVKIKPGRPIGTIKTRPATGVSRGNKDFKIIKHGSKAGMDLLKDCLGFTYTLKKVIGGGRKTYWCCSVRNKHLRCPASVIQYEDDQFVEGSFEHKHLPSFNIPAAPHENIPSLRQLREQHELDDSESEYEDDEMDHSYVANRSSGSVYMHSGKAGSSGNSRMRVAMSREKKRRDHQTFLGPRCTINLTKCDDSDCNCRLVHCPFCDKHHFKPTKAGRVQDHLELTHFAHGVQYDDLMIVKCFHDCDQEKSYGHFHCVFCFRMMLKRTAYARHMLRHMEKMGIPDRLLVLPDSKFPDIINAYGYEIPICKLAACSPPNQSKHYHCPSCNHVCRERSLTVNHLWRCLQKKRDGVTESMEETEEDIVGVIDEDQLMSHPSLVKSFKDIPLDKCMSIDCCNQNYHCKLCPENVFMPTYRQHLIAHYVTHWKQRVLYKNFSILKCFHPCDGVDRSMCKTRYHYHCPICGKIILTKGTFEEHLKTCHMFRFGENLIQNIKPEFDTAFEDDINLRQESAPLNENVEFMEDQLTSQAIKHAQREKQSRGYGRSRKGKHWKSKKCKVKQEVEEESDGKSRTIGEDDVYELCSAIISPKLTRKVKSVGQLRSILGGVAGATRVKLTTSDKGQYLLTGPAEELLEAQKMLTKKINKEIKSGKQTMKVKVTSHLSSSTKGKSPVTSPVFGEPKKGRGRPKKEARDDNSFPYSEIRQIIEASKEKNTNTPKRGRGRPPKNTPVKDLDRREEPKSIPIRSPSVSKQRGSSSTIKTPSPVTPKSQGRYSTRGVRKDYLEMSSGGMRREIKQEPISDSEEFTTETSQKPTPVSGKRRGRPPKQHGKGKATVKGSIDDDEIEKSEEDFGDEGDVSADSVEVNADLDKSDEETNEEPEETDEGEDIGADDNSLVEEEDMSDSLSLFDASDDDLYDDDEEDDSFKEDNDGKDCKDTDTLPDEEMDDKSGTVDSRLKNVKSNQSKAMTVPPVVKLGMRKSNLPKTKLAQDEGEDEIPKEDGEAMEGRKVDKKCSLCEDFKAESFSGLTQHLKVFHHVYDPPRCDVCEEDFDTVQSLNVHIDKKHGPFPEKMKYICDYPACGKELTSDSGLQGHVNRVHLGVSKVPKEKRYACEKCSYKCNSIEDIYEHKKVEHDEMIQCEECNKEFPTYPSLKRHNQLTHNTTNVSCTVCNKTFNNESYLNKHMKSHFVTEDFTCNICKKVLRTKTSLRDHLETHKEPSERTYRYICSYCGKQFALKSNLSDHVNKHTGARPYKCDICLKAFGFRSMLMKHKTFVHSSERPFKCGVCHKGFKFMNLLQNHITTHTNTSKHVCPHCAKTFSTASTLKFHAQKCRGLGWNRKLMVQLPPQSERFLVYTDQGHSQHVNNVQRMETADSSTQQQQPEIVFDTAGDGNQAMVYESLQVPGDGSTIEEIETVIQEPPKMMESEIVMEPAQTESSLEQVPVEYAQVQVPAELAQEQVPAELAREQVPAELGPEQVRAEYAQNTIEVYACSECKATFNTYEEAEVHVMTAHSVVPSQMEETMELGADGM